ncbi:uncharacterized protein LOC126354680 [Schistocerca gregaria]|uniref:uncharacterized protein LOC126354680 n=1 Tax=Schistocerca gregaria TaxID=7010 RepID=UPI00211E4E59|nr:uncharacterized protein LOC126354680 [Schistocerca gregaria]
MRATAMLARWLLILLAVAGSRAFPAADEEPASYPVGPGEADTDADASASATSLLEEGIEGAYRLVKDCGERPLTACLKMRALTLMDRALRQPGDLPLLEGVALVRSTAVSGAATGRALTQEELDATLPRDADEKDAQVETMLVDRVARFLQSHTLQLKVPDSAISEVRRTLDEARGKKKKLKMLLPLLLLMKLKAAAIIPLALGALALLALKALIVGKLALVLAGLIALQKLLASRQGTQTYEVVAHPHYSHSHVSSYGDEHGHYGRSLPDDGAAAADAHQMAYSAYAKAE